VKTRHNKFTKTFIIDAPQNTKPHKYNVRFKKKLKQSTISSSLIHRLVQRPLRYINTKNIIYDKNSKKLLKQYVIGHGHHHKLVQDIR